MELDEFLNADYWNITCLQVPSDEWCSLKNGSGENLESLTKVKSLCDGLTKVGMAAYHIKVTAFYRTERVEIDRIGSMAWEELEDNIKWNM